MRRVLQPIRLAAPGAPRPLRSRPLSLGILRGQGIEEKEPCAALVLGAAGVAVGHGRRVGVVA